MKIDFLEDEIRLTETPLAIIKILTPTQALAELTTKTNKYFKNGVKSCWLVLPTLKNIYVFSTITDYHIFDAQEILKDENLGIEIHLVEIFK